MFYKRVNMRRLYLVSYCVVFICCFLLFSIFIYTSLRFYCCADTSIIFIICLTYYNRAELISWLQTTCSNLAGTIFLICIKKKLYSCINLTELSPGQLSRSIEH